MEHRYATLGMKPRGGLCLFLAMAVNGLCAQVAQYVFSQSNGTWTELITQDGGYDLGTPTTAYSRVYVDPAVPAGAPSQSYVQPVSGPGLPIGFDFAYNGEQFDRIGISSQGWISFGKSVDGANAVSVYGADGGAAPLSTAFHNPTPSYKRNRVAGFGAMGLRAQDRTLQDGFASSLRMATIGTAPNRVCVVQWKDFRRTFDWNQDRITFQVRLHETSNVVEVSYGPMQWGASSVSPEVGVGGTSSADHNNRRTVYQQPTFRHDWNTTAAGTAANSVCRAYDPSATQVNEPSAYPAVGLSFRWSPPACPSPAPPFTISPITATTATVTWNTTTGASSYDHVVTTTQDPDTPTPVASGNTTGTNVEISGLSPMTDYYVFVRSRCGSEMGPWSGGTSFRTQAGQILACGEQPVQSYHCSTRHTRVTWHYIASDGESPVRIIFLNGYVGTPSMNGGERFRVYDGPDTLAPVLYQAQFSGQVEGQVFTSSGPDLFVELRTTAGACDAQPFYLPWEWLVGCKNCTEPLANYTVVQDCPAGEFSVDVGVFSMGTADSLIITSGGAADTVVAANVGTHTTGPFPAGQEVVITLRYPGNSLCDVEGVPLVNEPCPTVDCGPTDHTYCYGDNENSQWLYQGEGQPLGLRFRNGRLGGNDQLRIYDDVDPFSVVPWSQTSGDLSNTLHISTNPQHALFMELSSNPAGSCESGLLPPWEYVVACHDGCTQPQAVFTTLHDCDNGRFNVSVEVTDLGSTGSVTITNNGGAPEVEATGLGTYVVGPFASQVSVLLEVQGGSVLCAWSSTPQTFDCNTIGMEEYTLRALRAYPNPGDGRFRVELPEGMSGTVETEVLDLSGRRVWSSSYATGAQGELLLELGHLPAGVYMAVLVNNGQRHLARLSIAR